MGLKHCAECKDEFLAKYQSQAYCSRACANRVKARETRGKARKARASRRCPTCGEAFKVTPANVTNKYCSKPCSNKGRAKITKAIRTCRQCKGKFEVYPSYERARGKSKFCSVACSREYARTHRPPKLERSYVDNLFSRLVRRRDGCCLCCGATEALQCAHVITRDVMVLRADLENAITLCYRHHLHWWHKDIVGAGRWFEQKWPGRYDRLLKKKKEAEAAMTKVNWRDEFKRLRAIEAEWDQAMLAEFKEAA